MEFLCNKDLRITDIKTLNNDVEIKDISVKTELDGKSMDRLFDKEDGLPLEKGSKVYPKLTLADKNFKNSLDYSTTIYLAIEYEVEGDLFVTYFESQFVTTPNVYEVIFRELEEVNFLPFYKQHYINLGDKF